MTVRDWQHRAEALGKLGENEEAHRHNSVAAEYFNRAYTHYRRALEMAPGAPSVHGNVGVSLLRLGRREEGIEFQEKEIELHPDNVESLFALALTYQAANRFDQAVTCLRRSIALLPDHFPSWAALAHLFAHLGGEPDRVDAVEHLKQIYESESFTEDSSEAIRAPAVAATRGDVKTAMDLHLWSTKRFPSVPAVWFNMALTCHVNGAFEIARNCYDRASGRVNDFETTVFRI
jgi:Tfp pilus assembly protein PilF